MDADLIQKKPSNNFITLIVDAFSNIRFKLLIMIYIMFVFLSSDVFVDRVLSNFEGAVDIRSATNYGIMIQGMFLVLGYVVLEILIDQSIL
jgi:hypothetical protein